MYVFPYNILNDIRIFFKTDRTDLPKSVSLFQTFNVKIVNVSYDEVKV